MNDKISLYAPPISRFTSYFEMVNFAVEQGMKNVETLNTFELSTPDLEFAKKLRKYADDRGIKIPCVSVGLDMVGDDYKEVTEMVKKYADVASILGSPYLHHTIVFEFENPDKVTGNIDLYYERGLKVVREVYDYAEKLGVKTVFEDQGYLFNGVTNYKKFLNDIGRNVGTVADFGNIMFVDDCVEKFIPAFADRVVNVHIKDYLFTPGGSRAKNSDEYFSLNKNYLKDTMFGEGSVNFDAAFAELKKMGYDGYFAMECPPMGDDEVASFKKNAEMLGRYIDGLKG